MIVKLTNSRLQGEITPLASKSVAHRALICAFLANQKCKLKGNFEVDDIKATINCLRALGGKITKVYDGLEIEKSELLSGATLDARESGSTLRFLIPVVSALGVEATFIGSKRLSNRPITELLDVLEANGAQFLTKSLPLTVKGKMTGGDIEIDGSVSSQYVTGLLLALSALKNGGKLKILGEKVSKDYVEITISVLESFGVKIIRSLDGYEVISGYNSPDEFEVEADWSSACFGLCLGALCGRVKVSGLNLNSRQGDKIIVELLQKIGAKVEIGDNFVTVENGELNAISFDGENYPDIVPVLSAVLASCKGISKIYNVQRLKDKESDRLFETLRMLKTFGIFAEYKDNAIVIYGGKPTGACYESPNDHRMAMAGSVLALTASGESSIIGAECVAKSYPCFFEHIKSLIVD